MSQKYYSPEDVSNILGVSKNYVYKQIRENNITYRKLGQMVRISDDDLEEFVNREVHPMVIEAAEKYRNA